MLTISIFCIGTVIAIEREWGTIQTTFFAVEIIVIVMKMHSYLTTNREYGETYELLKKNQKRKDENPTSESNIPKKVNNPPESGNGHTEGEDEVHLPKNFPRNVTVLNFIEFLIVPTLIYQSEYPKYEFSP